MSRKLCIIRDKLMQQVRATGHTDLGSLLPADRVVGRKSSTPCTQPMSDGKRQLLQLIFDSKTLTSIQRAHS